MTIAGSVCSVCNGRGLIFTSGGVRPCPRGCEVKLNRTLEEILALKGLRVCYERHRDGGVTNFNLHLAIRRALLAGFEPEELSNRCGVPLEIIEHAEGRYL